MVALHVASVTSKSIISASLSRIAVRFKFKHESKSSPLCRCSNIAASKYQHSTATMVAFFILYMRWINSYQAMLNIAMTRRRNRTLRRQHIAPYQWSIPRPAESWFEIHYNDPTVPQEYFRQQLGVYKNTFDLIRNIHGLRYHAIANHELFYRCDRQVMTFRAALSFV